MNPIQSDTPATFTKARRSWKWFHVAFKTGIALKGLNGVLETIAGVTLLVTNQAAIRGLVGHMTREELLEDPHDFMSNHLVNFFNHLSISTQHFAGFYLLAYGIAKTGLALGLFCEKLWSFPVALALLSLFILYQAYRFSETHSIILAVLTLFDAMVVVLIWIEYQHLKTFSVHTRPA